MQLRGIVFDCDGVLFESRQANLAYYNRILEQFGKPLVSPDDSLKGHLCHTAASPVVFAELLADESQQQVMAFAATLSYRQFVGYMNPEPGMVAVLRLLSEMFPLAVATNRGTSMYEILQHFSLSEYFSHVVTSRDVSRPKPYPDMLHYAAEQLGCEPGELLFIGDSELDSSAAQSAGMPFIGYKRSFNGGQMINHHDELLELVQELRLKI